MNRVSLIACAAALMVAWPVVISAQEKTMTTFTGMELVWIPPGEFMMGSTPEEREWAKANGCKAMWTDREGQQPRRTAIKDGYWLARTEMTVGHWRKFVEATGFVTDAERNSKASWRQPKAGFEPKDSHPVTCLSWNDAMAYCRWLTETETKAGTLPKGMVCRLPTEAEWEYACRAGKQTKFWWGDETSGCEKRLNLYGTADGFEYVSPVDSFGAAGRNGFGLADMLGNAWEWCLDEGDPLQAHAECHAGNPESRVLRGASCQHYVGFQRCAVRGIYQPTDSTNHYGFRMCCGVPGGSGEPSTSTTPLVAAVPPAELPPPSTAPTAAKVTPPAAPSPPTPATPAPSPAKPMVTTAPVSPPALRVVGVKQTIFEICNLSTSAQFACINNAWTRNVSCIEAALRVNEDLGEKQLIMKAYFYNKDRQMVKELPHPTSVSLGGGESYQSPAIYKAGKKYTVYFGVTESVQRGKDKWKHAIVVFGDRNNVTADIHPKDDIAQFDFPEKDLVLRGRGK